MRNWSQQKVGYICRDLPDHRTTSLDVMRAKADIVGFLAVRFILAQIKAHIIVTKGDRIV